MVKTLFKTSQIGSKIEGVRRIKNMSQETLANLLGISRQTLSSWEQQENIEAEKLDAIAKALDVPVDTIKNYSEDAVITYIQNNYSSGADANFFGNETHYTNNPLDKMMTLVEENKALYLKLIESEREKVEILKKQVEHLSK